MSLLVYLDIICMNSCKCTKIKCHTTSVFVCLVFPSDSSSVIWGHSCRLLYSWDSPYLVPYCTCTTLIKCHGGVDVLPLFAIFLCLVSVPSMTLASWCVWDWSSQYTHMYSFCASWSWFLDMQIFFGPLSQLPVTSPCLH